MTSPALIDPLLPDRFPKKLPPNVPNNILKNPLFCPFASFLIFSQPFINKPDYTRDLTIFIISFISSFEIIDVAREAKSEGCALDQNLLLWIAASIANAAGVNPKELKHF